jgi:hypothetical protein
MTRVLRHLILVAKGSSPLYEPNIVMGSDGLGTTLITWALRCKVGSIPTITTFITGDNSQLVRLGSLYLRTCGFEPRSPDKWVCSINIFWRSLSGISGGLLNQG